MGICGRVPLEPVQEIARSLVEQLKADEYCPYELRVSISTYHCNCTVISTWHCTILDVSSKRQGKGGGQCQNKPSVCP